MVKPSLSLVAVLLSLSLPVVGCRDASRSVSSEAPTRNGGEASADAEAALQQARLDARDEIKRELDELDQQIAEVHVSYERRRGTDEAEAVTNRLTRKLTALRSDSRRLDSAPANTLGAIKRDLEVGVDDVNRSISEARQSI